MNREWKTETEYKVGDVVYCLQFNWRCKVEHKANVFAKDVQELYYWEKV